MKSMKILHAVLVWATLTSTAFAAGHLGGHDHSHDDEDHGHDDECERCSTQITIVNFQFVPDQATVTLGDCACFTNEDVAGHSVQTMGNTSAFTSGDFGAMKQGDKFVWTPDPEYDVGEHEYYCMPHTDMTGTLTVVADEAPSSAPSTWKDVSSEMCECVDEWTDEASGGTCGEVQFGCPKSACDGDTDGSWCVIKYSGCMGEVDGEGWAYCDAGVESKESDSTEGPSMEDVRTMVEDVVDAKLDKFEKKFVKMVEKMLADVLPEAEDECAALSSKGSKGCKKNKKCKWSSKSKKCKQK